MLKASPKLVYAHNIKVAALGCCPLIFNCQKLLSLLKKTLESFIKCRIFKGIFSINYEFCTLS